MIVLTTIRSSLNIAESQDGFTLVRMCEGGGWGAFGIQSEFVHVYSTSADELPERVMHSINIKNLYCKLSTSFDRE